MNKQFGKRGKQNGGTLLGLILGLIIGLGIAVVVAVTIKNTPLPFVNKLAKPEKTTEQAGRISDPNRPLYGNSNAAKEAAKEFSRRNEEEKAAAQEEKTAKEAAPAAEAPKEPKPTLAKASPRLDSKQEPKADAAVGQPPVVERSTPEKSGADKAQKADNADEKFIYYLQAGAFREQGDAENTKARLALMGVQAAIAERPSENGTLYRVRIGPFGQAEVMNRMRSKLSDNGVDVAVVRVPK